MAFKQDLIKKIKIISEKRCNSLLESGYGSKKD